jgi:hypothetical protein
VFGLKLSLLGCDGFINGGFLSFRRCGSFGCRLGFLSFGRCRSGLVSLIEFLPVLSNEVLLQSTQLLRMMLGEFLRSRRWCIARFACGFLHSGLDGGFLLLCRLLACHLLLAYPSAELFLSNHSQREPKYAKPSKRNYIGHPETTFHLFELFGIFPCDLQGPK